MHVVFVTTQVITQHATLKRALELGPAMQERGWRVTVLLQDHPDNREALQRVGLDGRFHACGLGWSKEARQKEAHLRELRPDVVSLCGLGWRNFLSREAAPQAQWIMDFDEMISTIRLFPWWFRKLQQRLESIGLRRYEGVVCASRYLEFYFRRELFRQQVTKPVLWLPYAYAPSFRQRVRKERQRVPSPPFEITYMGGLWRQYGCFTMLEALGHLATRRTDWRARLFGRGRDADACREWIRARGLEDRILLPGYVPVGELESALIHSDLHLAPMFDTEQDWARCPSKIYPYIATGRPIVTAPVGENAEALGEEAFYYQPGNSTAMATAIDQALTAIPDWQEPVYVDQHSWTKRAERWDQWVRSSLLPN